MRGWRVSWTRRASTGFRTNLSMKFACVLLCAALLNFVNGDSKKIPMPLIAAGKTDHLDVKPLVYNGQDADMARYPYFASLRRERAGGMMDSHHFCGGVLVGPSTVLTAAHCMNTEPLPIVHIGRYCSENCPEHMQNMDGNYIVARVVSTETPPGWNEAKFYRGADIAYLRLDREISGVSPIHLYNPSIDQPPSPGQRLTVIGLGTDHHGGLADFQQIADMPYVPNEECRSRFRASDMPGLPDDFDIEEDMICAGGDDQSACTGDSGGPLIIQGAGSNQDILYGVVSFGVLCGTDGMPDMPTVFTRISEYSDAFLKDFYSTPVDSPDSNWNGLEHALDDACSSVDDGSAPLTMTFPIHEDSQCQSLCRNMPLCDAYEFRREHCELQIMCLHAKQAVAAVSGLRRPAVHDPKTGPDFWPMLPPQANGDTFRVADGWDCTGSHFKSTSGLDPDSCREACSSFYSCSAYTFSYDSELCLFKNNCDGWRRDSETVSGKKVHRGNTDQRYKIHERTGCVGQTIQGYVVNNIEECERECDYLEFCAAFTFNTRSNRCFLKAACPRRIKRNNISGVKKHFDLPSILYNIGCNDPTLKAVNVDKFEDCEEECRDTRHCKAYTYDKRKSRCYLKEACFMQKNDPSDMTGFIELTM